MWIISRRACLLYYIRMWWFVFCAGDRLAKMLQFVDNIADSHLMLRFFHDTHHKSRARFELSFYFSRLISSIPTPPTPPRCLNASQAIENLAAPGGYDVKIIPEDPSSRSIRLVTEMMVLVGEGMGR